MFYVPELARFLSRDMVRRPGKNPYSYAGNEPLTTVDPDGNQDTPLPAGDPGYPFGETSSLRPQWRQPTEEEIKAGKEAPKTRENYDPKSSGDLAKARQAICEIARNREKAGRKNPPRHDVPSDESLNNPNVAYEWAKCKEAADACSKERLLEEDCQHFYIRKGAVTDKDGSYMDKPNWAGNAPPKHSYGPFRNLGGGDVKAGQDIYIDVYCGVK